MKITKLTPNDIKECIERFKPEGFRKTSDLGFYVPTDTNPYKEAYIYYSEFMESIVYKPLFLTRTIEGINSTIPDVCIVTFWSGEGWWCYDCGDDKFNLPATTYDKPDQAKESAILYILNSI